MLVVTQIAVVTIVTTQRTEMRRETTGIATTVTKLVVTIVPTHRTETTGIATTVTKLVVTIVTTHRTETTATTVTIAKNYMKNCRSLDETLFVTCTETISETENENEKVAERPPTMKESKKTTYCATV